MAWVGVHPPSFCNRYGFRKNGSRSPPFVTASANAASNFCWFRPAADVGSSPKAASNLDSHTLSPRPSRLLKRRAFMGGWKKSPSPVTSVADLTPQLRPETRGVLPDHPRQTLGSLPTFAKYLGWKRHRNRIETPPGFRLKKRSSACSMTARRNLAANWLASLTVLCRGSSDSTAAGGTLRIACTGTPCKKSDLRLMKANAYMTISRRLRSSATFSASAAARAHRRRSRSQCKLTSGRSAGRFCGWAPERVPPLKRCRTSPPLTAGGEQVCRSPAPRHRASPRLGTDSLELERNGPPIRATVISRRHKPGSLQPRTSLLKFVDQFLLLFDHTFGVWDEIRHRHWRTGPHLLQLR